jgi:disulfide bond formation protein DsbB
MKHTSKIIPYFSANYIQLVFLTALMGVLGSLYFSEVLKIEPCLLCWYQRIFFYPIFIITLIALLSKEKLRPRYILALSVPGMLIALYHYLLQATYNTPGNIFAPCSPDNLCAIPEVIWIGFVTIPLLSFAGFAVITIFAGAAQLMERTNRHSSLNKQPAK